jgi:hypothetical protein
MQLMVTGGRAEVPQHRCTAARQHGEANHLVHGPRTDVRRSHVPDVVEVEREKRAQAGAIELGLQFRKPLLAKPIHVESIFPIDVHRSVRGRTHVLSLL